MSNLLPPWLPIFSAMLGVLAVTHGFLWLRLIRSPGLRRGWRWGGSLLLLLLALSIPLNFVMGRDAPFPGWEIFLRTVFLWIGVMGLLFSFLLGAEILRWAGRLAMYLRGGEFDPGRRVLFSRAVAGGALLGTAGVSAFATRAAAAAPQLRKVQVALPRLPESLSGITIAQISDLHVGVNIGRGYVADVVRRVNALKPDIIAITGDLVDGEAGYLSGDIVPIGQLKARHGVYFVPGNHEYYSGLGPWLHRLRTMGLKILRNSHVCIGTGKDSFCLAGVDDSDFRAYTQGHGANVGRALEGVTEGQEIVLLAHRPREIFDAAKHGVGLQLSGHTHGGQMWPMTWLVPLTQPYVAGLARHENTQIYVSTGTGYWGPPMRLGTESEITLIELVREGAADAKA